MTKDLWLRFVVGAVVATFIPGFLLMFVGKFFPGKQIFIGWPELVVFLVWAAGFWVGRRP